MNCTKTRILLNAALALLLSGPAWAIDPSGIIVTTPRTGTLVIGNVPCPSGAHTITDCGKTMPTGPFADTDSVQTFTNKTYQGDASAVTTTPTGGNIAQSLSNIAGRIIYATDFSGVTCNVHYGVSGPATVVSGNNVITLPETLSQSYVGSRISITHGATTFNSRITAISGTSVTLADTPAFNAPVYVITLPATVVAGGSAYVAGDTLTANDQNATTFKLGTSFTGGTVTSGNLAFLNVATQGHDTTAPSGTLSLSGGSGSGLQITASYKASTGYYVVGADDGAAINTALASLPSSLVATLIVPGCGTTVPIVVPSGITLAGRGNAQILSGGTPGLVALAPMAELVDFPAAFGQSSGAHDLLLDGFLNATDVCFNEGKNHRHFSFLTCENGITSDFRTTKGGNDYNTIVATTDINWFPDAAQRATYGFNQDTGSSDDVLVNINASNAATADIESTGGFDHFVSPHCFGYPIYEAPTYCFEASGNATWDNPQADGAVTADFHIASSGVRVTDLSQQDQWAVLGTTVGVLIDTGLDNINVKGTRSLDFSALNMIVQSGTAGTNTIVTNNPGALYETASGGNGIIGCSTTACTATGIGALAHGVGSSATANYAAAIGNSNTADGAGSWAIGQAAVARQRPGCFIFAANKISVAGDAQIAKCILKGTGTGTSAVRLTTDLAAATNRNCYNTTAAGQTNGIITIQVTVNDRTTPTNYFIWKDPGPAVLARPTNAASTAFATKGTPVAQGYGAAGWTGLTSGAITETEDKTNSCINLSFTPPSPNTDTFDITAVVEGLETQ